MSFPTVIDNTILKSFVTCPTMTKHRHIENLRLINEKMVDLHFGKCFATGVEFVRKLFWAAHATSDMAVQGGIEAAAKEWGNFQEPTKSYKSLGTLVRSLRYYFEVWPLGQDGFTPVGNGIECMFSIPIPILHPITGEFLEYAGRYDMLATEDATGRLYIVDEKTASKLGDSWVNQWDLDSQMTGYIWSVQQERICGEGLGEFPSILAQIRGVSILKDGNGHVEIPISRPQWMVDRWYTNMLGLVHRMVDAYQRNDWDMAQHGNACVSYNRPCDYTALCCSPNPERLIEGTYHTVVWNPVAGMKK
jgi:hypothetical protein